ncbi:hypothetical protein TcasGA2_TC005127 [Tribolium castaneum]|uniref:Uncharacterized protein n=1 Tax=Tribolium castaneum TaxID=7070 RepID=D7EIN5_TRICA|nr:hypothetical protein TcasGA2_TC005127 [Tribolium castaneum]
MKMFPIMDIIQLLKEVPFSRRSDIERREIIGLKPTPCLTTLWTDKKRMDDTTDITETSQCAVSIRYGDSKSGILYERFFGFHNVSKDKTASGLYDLLIKILEPLDYTKKLVAQCFDGAAVMSALLSSWKKDEIKRWLEEKKIVHPQDAFKQEFLAIAKSNKQDINYKVDKLVEEHGHKVLRLPLYQCHYNPIEHVWALSKIFYNKHIGKVDSTDESILQTWQKASYTRSLEQHSQSLRQTNRGRHKKQICLDQVQKEIIINVNSDNDSDSDSDFGEFDDTASESETEMLIKS